MVSIAARFFLLSITRQQAHNSSKQASELLVALADQTSGWWRKKAF
jgi:hypothetical protein